MIGGYGESRYAPVAVGDPGVVLCTPIRAGDSVEGESRDFVRGAGW